MSSSEKKRVLFLSYNFPPKLGGQEQVIVEVWREFCRRSDTTALVQFGACSAESPGRVEPASRSGLFSYFRFILARGRQLFETAPFDLIVASNGLVAWPAQRLASRFGCEAVGMLFGLDTIHSSPLYQFFLRRALPRLTRILAISEATAREAVARGAGKERIRVLPPGCHANRFRELPEVSISRAKWNLEDSPVILSPGRLVPRKGMDRFIEECFPLILRRVPRAQLVLAGGNPEGALLHTDDMGKRVNRIVEKKGYRDRVRVTGRLTDEEMIEIYGLADVVILPAIPVRGDMEGFGIVLLEAAAAGKPSVATRTGGIPDAVVDGETGYLVEPFDYPAMADRVVKLLTDRETASALGEAGRRRVFESFRWEDVARRYADFLLGNPS